jgi:hypothetical protein
MRRLKANPDSYLDPSRWLFGQIRHHFPLCQLEGVWLAVSTHVERARQQSRSNVRQQFDDPHLCAALTLTGERCRNRPMRGEIVCATHRYDAPLAGLPIAVGT